MVESEVVDVCSFPVAVDPAAVAADEVAFGQVVGLVGLVVEFVDGPVVGLVVGPVIGLVRIIVGIVVSGVSSAVDAVGNSKILS